MLTVTGGQQAQRGALKDLRAQAPTYDDSGKNTAAA